MLIIISEANTLASRSGEGQQDNAGGASSRQMKGEGTMKKLMEEARALLKKNGKVVLVNQYEEVKVAKSEKDIEWMFRKAFDGVEDPFVAVR
jgi:tRNA1(Val) A37 N6-methylase TrmN6